MDPGAGEKILDKIVSWIDANPGRALGTTIGFLIGLSLITLGFWRTLVIVVATWLGYSIGRSSDDEGKGFRELLEDRFPGRPHFH
ncbi:MAG: DUF2273 domain-containing protein [Bacillota bacterium]